ncbi:MAG: J domain-containing protein [Clostridiaceae bacterium]|nr:J domain-containing protein [Clostridiaceae bacterium]
MLSRAECLRILELDPKANSYDIENRYTMLIKRYRSQNDPETTKKLEQITLAYDILTDRYVEPEPIDPRLEEVVWGKKKREWQNLWHYGRWPLLGILVGVFFLGYLIYSIVTNEPPDFQFVAVGQYASADNADERVRTYVADSMADVETVEFQLIPLSFTPPDPTGGAVTGGLDPESEYMYVMKMMTMIAGETIETFICEKSAFDQYAPQGTFNDLSALYERLQDLPEEVKSKIKPLRRALIDVYENPTPGVELPWKTEEDMNQDLSLPIYGLDVSELHLVEGLGLYGKSQVLTIGFKADDPAAVEQFLEDWVRDYETMHELKKAYEEALKATAAAAKG